MEQDDFFEKNKPITPGISYFADQFTHTLYYKSATYPPGLENQDEAYTIFLKGLDKFRDDLNSENDASRTMSMIAQVLNFDRKKQWSPTIDFVEEHFDNVTKRITTEGLNEQNMIGETHQALNVITAVLDRMEPSDSRSTRYFELLRKYKAEIFDHAKKGDDSMAKDLCSFLYHAYERGDKQEAGDQIKEILFTGSFPESSKYSFFKKLQNNEWENLVYIFFGKEMEKYIKNPYINSDVISSLECYAEGTTLLNYYEVHKTLNVCRQIEEKMPNGCEMLNKIFGITHFGRYSVEDLIEQLNDWDKGDNTPYGVIVSSWDDWNNAFNDNRDEHQGTVAKIIKQVKRFGYKTRIIEARNKEEFVMKQLALSDRFNKAGKFLFLCVAAHGEASGFRLGRYGERVGIEDIPLIKKDLAPIYSSSMQTVFFSCSTGVDDGFAEEWSDSKIESIGPDKPSHEKEVEVFSRLGGLLGFRVVYGKAEQKRYPRLR